MHQEPRPDVCTTFGGKVRNPRDTGRTMMAGRMAATAEQCELTFRQVAEYSRLSDGSFLETTSGST